MTGESIKIKPEYFSTAEEILKCIQSSTQTNVSFPKVIAIGGESGSGKSITAICLQQSLNKAGIETYILHMDNYFHLPPAANHRQREENISHVGPKEVNLDLLQSHIKAFKEGVFQITKPFVYYAQDLILPEEVNLSPYKCVIVEGTYVCGLSDIDYRIFMDRTYKETYAQRMERGRDVASEFVERVLCIEHPIIRDLKKYADIVISSDYKVQKVNKHDA